MGVKGYWKFFEKAQTWAKSGSQGCRGLWPAAKKLKVTTFAEILDTELNEKSFSDRGVTTLFLKNALGLIQ